MQALAQLGATDKLSEALITGHKAYIYKLYVSHTELTDVASLLSFLTIFVSSANFSTLLVTLSFKPLIYIKNNIGINTDPCRTPLKNDFHFETSTSITHETA